MRFLAAVVTVFLTALPAFGWSSHQHRVVATVAEAELPDDVKRQIRTILQNKSLADVAVEPDNWRLSKAESRAWHFVSIPYDSRSYSAVRDCPGGNCIVAAIEKFERVLADTNQSREKRAEALTYLTHFIADIHQPLHVTSRNNDRNAETVRVTYGTRSTTLHQFWDIYIYRTPPDVATHVKQIQALRGSTKDLRSMGYGDAERWANESHQISRDWVYKIPADGKLTDSYAKQSLTIIDKQLLRASERLRATLIRLLGAKGK